jgi:hypothetical protein
MNYSEIEQQVLSLLFTVLSITFVAAVSFLQLAFRIDFTFSPLSDLLWMTQIAKLITVDMFSLIVGSTEPSRK